MSSIPFISHRMFVAAVGQPAPVKRRTVRVENVARETERREKTHYEVAEQLVLKSSSRQALELLQTIGS